ncbi:hypothetical protein JG688_00012934 [Phytophthora aleatoria]|uniref:Uncharacterized protein n=1 Tax=Phytophthora aleatoria TaxID=2496075 RepID=A0A8J5M4C5_9STRA|nr:hypothetical protein JG688_00012934 [Phytophthora aleatoria]
MLRGSVVLHETNSSASSIDQELISPSKLTQLISKLKANRRCFRSLLDAEKCIILTMTSSSSTPSAPNMRTLFGIAFALISTSFFCVDGALPPVACVVQTTSDRRIASSIRSMALGLLIRSFGLMEARPNRRSAKPRITTMVINKRSARSTSRRTAGGSISLISKFQQPKRGSSREPNEASLRT